MAFEWNRIHKSEDYVDNIVSEIVFERVTEHYEVEDVIDLTQEQLEEIVYFREHELQEYSPLQRGFSDVINRWESENWE